jgi:hypothetical protein
MMKEGGKGFLLGLLIILIIGNSSACDVCGSAAGAANMGILPQFYKNFIGLQFFTRTFQSRHPVLGSAESTLTNERFQTIEFRGRFHINKRIQWFVLMPYHINKQQEDDLQTTISGLGDLTTFANYNLFDDSDQPNKVWKHNLQVGGGLKLPFGRFNTLNKSNVLNPYIQTGSGSVDFIADVIYTVRRRQLGFNTTAFYKYNTINTNDYRFGNRLTATAQLFYLTTWKGVTILPSLGLNYEFAEKDIRNSFTVMQSGGMSSLMVWGLDLYLDNLTVGIGCQLPIYQNNTLSTSGNRLTTTILFNF